MPLTDFTSWPTFLDIGPPGHLTSRWREGRSGDALRAGVRSNGVGDQEEARAFAEGPADGRESPRFPVEARQEAPGYTTEEETMKEFLVEMTMRVPEGTDQAEVDRRRAAEAVRAKELAAEGHLSRLWRTVGEPRVIAVWRAADEAELREKVLGSLPLWPWATAVITTLQPHPNDPGLTG